MTPKEEELVSELVNINSNDDDEETKQNKLKDVVKKITTFFRTVLNSREAIEGILTRILFLLVELRQIKKEIETLRADLKKDLKEIKKTQEYIASGKFNSNDDTKA